MMHAEGLIRLTFDFHSSTSVLMGLLPMGLLPLGLLPMGLTWERDHGSFILHGHTGFCFVWGVRLIQDPDPDQDLYMHMCVIYTQDGFTEQRSGCQRHSLKHTAGRGSPGLTVQAKHVREGVQGV